MPAVDARIAELAPKEQELASLSANASEKKKQLDAISSNIAACAIRVGALERFSQSLFAWRSSLESFARGQPVFELWPDDAGPDLLTKSRASVERAGRLLHQALKEVQEAATEVESQLRSSQQAKLEFENGARQLRREVEALQQGAGVIARQGQQLRERKAHLESLKNVLAERRNMINSVLAQRDTALDQLDSVREQRFSVRHSVASKLNETLGPRIRVDVFRAGQFKTFAAAITDALRGSGLRYNELSENLAGKVSPRELLEATERNDFDRISDASGIARDRSARALGHLRESDLGALATVAVEDTVTLQLLDGADYKDVAKLSTGQRCTVVLPLVLRHVERALIVDQPEDHIDNAFIADTLITSILARTPDSQIIFSTHNANIPVLGNADWVIQLGSDGKRGYPVLSSNLDDPLVVNAITTVMEGGADAFKRRARFYQRYSTP